jgi:hypothetical protein
MGFKDNSGMSPSSMVLFTIISFPRNVIEDIAWLAIENLTYGFEG